MKQWKKSFLVLLCMALLLGTTACGRRDNDANDNNVNDSNQGVIEDAGDAVGDGMDAIGDGIEDVTDDVTGNTIDKTDKIDKTDVNNDGRMN